MYTVILAALIVWLIIVYYKQNKIINYHTRWLLNIETLLKDKELCDDVPSEWVSAVEDRGNMQQEIKAYRDSLQRWPRQ